MVCFFFAVVDWKYTALLFCCCWGNCYQPVKTRRERYFLYALISELFAFKYLHSTEVQEQSNGKHGTLDIRSVGLHTEVSTCVKFNWELLPCWKITETLCNRRGLHTAVWFDQGTYKALIFWKASIALLSYTIQQKWWLYKRNTGVRRIYPQGWCLSPTKSNYPHSKRTSTIIQR